MKRLAFLALLTLAGCASPPASAPAAAPCLARAPLPTEFAEWDTARPVLAATSAERLGPTRFVVGEAIDLALRPDGEVAYVTLPQGAGEAASFGGMAAFHVEASGRYRVGMSTAAWVDVSRGGQPGEAIAFGPGPRCTPVRKAVSFALEPGDYVLEISGNETADIRVMVARVPSG